MGMGWSAAVSAITNLAGSYMQSEAAKQAAATQANAANRATDLQQRMFQTINDQGAPYRSSGYSALDIINRGIGAPPQAPPAPPPAPVGGASAGVDANGQPLTFGTGDVGGNVKFDAHSGQYVQFLPDSNSWQAMPSGWQPPPASVNQAAAPAAAPMGGAGSGLPPGYFTTPFTSTDTYLAPNYQFRLQQGLGALDNQLSSRGGLLSGNSLRAISDYAQNTAADAYGQAFDVYSANQSNIYNRLASIAGLGQAANTTVAQSGSSLGSGMANSMMQAGAASAGGTVGSANAIAGGLNNAASWYTLSQMMNRNSGSGYDANFTSDAARSLQETG